MRIIFPETLELSSTINDPKVTAIIKESGGKMHMSEKQWDLALDELFESFKNYQEVGNGMKAKTLLKYSILGSIISDSTINYADTREAQVYKDDPEIAQIIKIRKAYEKNEFNTVLKLINEIEKDSFISKILDDFLRNM